MLKLLSKIIYRLNKILEVAVILLVATLLFDVLWGVMSRFLLNSPSRWTDELATILLIWVSLLGACVAYRAKAHLGVDYFVGKLDISVQRWVELFVNLIVAFFAIAVMVIGGYILVVKTLQDGQMSPSLGIKIGYSYLAVPISGIFITLFCLENIIENLTDKTDATIVEKSHNTTTH